MLPNRMQVKKLFTLICPAHDNRNALDSLRSLLQPPSHAISEQTEEEIPK
jgi:hypothetical protein